MSSILQELKNDFVTAEEWLLYYPERLRQYYQDLNYITNETVVPETFVSSGPGNIVLQKVVSMAELEKTEKWLLAVEMVHDILGPKKLLFLELRRRASSKKKTVNGREVWRGYVQQHYAEEMARRYNSKTDKFWLSDHSITIWWQEIVGLMRLVALKKECFQKKIK